MLCELDDFLADFSLPNWVASSVIEGNDVCGQEEEEGEGKEAE